MKKLSKSKNTFVWTILFLIIVDYHDFTANKDKLEFSSSYSYPVNISAFKFKTWITTFISSEAHKIMEWTNGQSRL